MASRKPFQAATHTMQPTYHFMSPLKHA